MENKDKPKIGALFIVLIVVIATLYDLLSLIPLVGSAIGWSFWVGVALVLWNKGYGLINPRRLITMFASTLGEFIPAIQALPLFLTGAIILVILLKAEEKLGLSLTGKAKIGGSKNKDGTRLPSSRPAPVNQNGIRMPEAPREENPEDTELKSYLRNSNTRPLMDSVRNNIKPGPTNKVDRQTEQISLSE